MRGPLRGLLGVSLVGQYRGLDVMPMRDGKLSHVPLQTARPRVVSALPERGESLLGYAQMEHRLLSPRPSGSHITCWAGVSSRAHHIPDFLGKQLNTMLF